VVVMKMARDDEPHTLRNVHSEAHEIFQGNGLTCSRIPTRVDDQPIAVPNVDDDAFAHARSEDRDFEFS
jgi:hypothetical protein